jgi:hypothetical protein
VATSVLGTDSQNDVIVAGTFYGTVDFGGGPLVAQGVNNNFFVAKYDCSGKHLWSKRFGAPTSSPSSNYVDALSVANDGSIVFSGMFQGPTDFGTGPLTQTGNVDGFVAKLDAVGNPVFAKSFGGMSQNGEGTGVVTDGTGNVFLTGYAFGPQNFGGGVIGYQGDQNYFVVEFDPTGNHVWSNVFGQGIASARIGLDPSGNVLLAGGSGTGTQLNFGGGTLPTGSIFAAKLASNGSYIWANGFGGNANVWALAVGPAGELIFTGFFDGPLDFGGGPLPAYGSQNAYLVKLTNAGSFVFSKANSSTMGFSSIGWGAAVNASGDVYWAGEFYGTIDLGNGPTKSTGLTSAFFAKFASTGTLSWLKSYGGTYTGVYAVALDTSATPTVAGYYNGTIDLGNGPLPTVMGPYSMGAAFLGRVAP